MIIKLLFKESLERSKFFWRSILETDGDQEAKISKGLPVLCKVFRKMIGGGGGDNWLHNWGQLDLFEPMLLLPIHFKE